MSDERHGHDQDHSRNRRHEDEASQPPEPPKLLRNLILVSVFTGIFAGVILAIVFAVRERDSAGQFKSRENLHKLAAAMHRYHDAHRGFPEPAIYDRKGQPLLSWRVALLPYIGESELFAQFNRNEPWDSPTNLPLLARMPAVYAAPDNPDATGRHQTFYRVFTGKGLIFEKGQQKNFVNITDGTSNTILIAEAGEAVPWTKPEELEYDVAKPLPRLGGAFPESKTFSVAMADGSVKKIKRDADEKSLRIAIEPQDGEVQRVDIFER